MTVTLIKDDPYWDKGMEGFLFKTAKKNYWKVASWYEFEDLIQDGLMVYSKCRAKFRLFNGTTLDEDQRTLMNYFQRAFCNHITDLQQDPRSRLMEEGFHDLSQEQEEALTSQLSSEIDLGDVGLASLLARAPAEIVDMLKKLLVDRVADVPYLSTPSRKRKRWAVRETTNQQIDRCLGEVGAAAKLREFLTSA